MSGICNTISTQRLAEANKCDEAHWATSSLTRRESSSLYSSATRLVYFLLISESFSNDEPPCRVKKSVAEPLPPTFIVRSCESCQVSRLVELEDEC